MRQVHSKFMASVTELKKNPNSLLEESSGEPIVILNHNKPIAYLISADVFEQILEIIEDKELGAIAEARKQAEKNKRIRISLDDL